MDRTETGTETGSTNSDAMLANACKLVERSVRQARIEQLAAQLKQIESLRADAIGFFDRLVDQTRRDIEEQIQAQLPDVDEIASAIRHERSISREHGKWSD